MLTGDLATLATMRRRIGRLVGVDRLTASASAGPIQSVWAASFAARTTPYGDPWRVKIDGTPATMNRTGRLRGSIRFSANGRKLKMDYGSVPYWKYMHGPRNFVPSQRDIPPTWRVVLDRESQRAWRDIAEGRR